MVPWSSMVDTEKEGYYQLLEMRQTTCQMLQRFLGLVEMSVILDVLNGSSRKPRCGWPFIPLVVPELPVVLAGWEHADSTFYHNSLQSVLTVLKNKWLVETKRSHCL